jgi:O-antigen ligase
VVEAPNVDTIPAMSTDASLRTGGAPRGRLLERLRHGLPGLTTVIAVAAAPVGIVSTLDWVWLIVLALLLATLLVIRPAQPVIRDAGLLLSFTAWIYLTLWWSDAPGDGREIVRAVALLPALYLTARHCGPSTLVHLRRVAGVWVLVLSVFLVGSEFVDHDFTGVGYDYPTRHAAMAMTAFVAIVLVSRRTSGAGIAIGGIALISSAISGARTASAAILLTVVVVLVVAMRRRIVSLLTIGAAAAVVAFVLAPAVFDPAGGMLGSVLDRGIDAPSRPDVWEAVTDGCGVTLFGSGAGTANVLARAAHPEFPDPHNEFIRFSCDTGLVGSILLWSFFGVAAWRTISLLMRQPKNRVALSSLLALMSLMLFSAVWNPVTAFEFTAPVTALIAFADQANRATRREHLA